LAVHESGGGLFCGVKSAKLIDESNASSICLSPISQKGKREKEFMGF
jgi:hypothetical protein